MSALAFATLAICGSCDANGGADEDLEELPPLLAFCYHQCSMGAHCDVTFYLFYEDENQCRLDCRDQEQSEYKSCLEANLPTEFKEARQELDACLLSLHKCTQWRAYYDSDPESDVDYPCKKEETSYLDAKENMDEASIYRECHEEETEPDQ